MAKKSIGLPFDVPARKNNQKSAGVIDRPDDSRYPDKRSIRSKSGCLQFDAMVAGGESPMAPDLNVLTPNGVANSRGKGKGMQYNWGQGTDGDWNDNQDWGSGSNFTGL